LGDKQGDYYAMSMRTTSDKVDLVKVIRKSTMSLRKARGGGHAKASGCKVLYKDKEVFLERFIRALHETI